MAASAPATSMAGAADPWSRRERQAAEFVGLAVCPSPRNGPPKRGHPEVWFLWQFSRSECYRQHRTPAATRRACPAAGLPPWEATSVAWPRTVGSRTRFSAAWSESWAPLNSQAIFDAPQESPADRRASPLGNLPGAEVFPGRFALVWYSFTPRTVPYPIRLLASACGSAAVCFHRLWRDASGPIPSPGEEGLRREKFQKNLRWPALAQAQIHASAGWFTWTGNWGKRAASVRSGPVFRRNMRSFLLSSSAVLHNPRTSQPDSTLETGNPPSMLGFLSFSPLRSVRSARGSALGAESLRLCGTSPLSL